MDQDVLHFFDGKPERLRVVCASKLGYAGNMEWGHFMKNEKIYQMDFSKVYHLLVNKAERRGRTRQEVDELARGKAMDKILRK